MESLTSVGQRCTHTRANLQKRSVAALPPSLTTFSHACPARAPSHCDSLDRQSWRHHRNRPHDSANIAHLPYFPNPTSVPVRILLHAGSRQNMKVKYHSRTHAYIFRTRAFLFLTLPVTPHLRSLLLLLLSHPTPSYHTAVLVPNGPSPPDSDSGLVCARMIVHVFLSVLPQQHLQSP